MFIVISWHVFTMQVEEAKQELQEVVEFLKNPHKFTVLGGKLPKGKNHCSADVKIHM